MKTASQSRDSLIESIPLSLSAIREAKNAAQDAEESRKQDAETYFKCPRCYSHHSVCGNFDNLCDSCVKTILNHFPDHASVPLIKKSLMKWKS